MGDDVIRVSYSPEISGVYWQFWPGALLKCKTKWNSVKLSRRLSSEIHIEELGCKILAVCNVLLLLFFKSVARMLFKTGKPS